MSREHIPGTRQSRTPLADPLTALEVIDTIYDWKFHPWARLTRRENARWNAHLLHVPSISSFYELALKHVRVAQRMKMSNGPLRFPGISWTDDKPPLGVAVQEAVAHS